MRWILFSLFLLLSAIPSIAQSILDIRIDFTANDELLEDALIYLSETSEVNISFRGRLIPKNKRVTIDRQNETLKAILKQLLKETNLTYKVVANQIILARKPPPPKRKHTISGYIEDAETGETLIGATVLDTLSGNGTSTNNYGFFSITLEEATRHLAISYTGYESKIQKLKLKENIQTNIALSPSVDLPLVIVTASDSVSLIKRFSNPNEERITREQIQKMPSLGGEADLFRVSYLLPGIQTGADGVGGLQVRGGSSDQNLVLLDGVTIYNPTHAIGIFSIFNTDAIKSVSILKGNFPARYGGRLSSVVDIRMKEGNQKKTSGEVSLGLISGKVALEGPILKDKIAYFLSFRRSLTDLYAPAITKRVKEHNNPNESGYSDYFFYDFNGKINVDFSDKDKLYLSVYSGADDFYDNSRLNFSVDDVVISINPFLKADLKGVDTDTTSLRWGNRMAALRWNHLFNQKLFANTSFSYTNYDFYSQRAYTSLGEYSNGDTDKITSSQTFQSEITTWAIKSDLEYSPSPRHEIKIGASAMRHEFQPGALVQDAFFINVPLMADSTELSAISEPNNRPAFEFSAYIEDKIKLTSFLYANIGLRASRWQIETAGYNYVQPRLHLKALLGKRLSLGFSYSQMVQPFHFLTTSNIGLPGDIWVPSTEQIAPQTARQIGGDMQYLLTKNLKISAAAYIKKLDHTITFLEQDSLFLLNTSDWEEQIAVGQGEAKGFEFSLKKEKGKTAGWLSYTLAWSERQFEEINGGLPYPFRYDRRHSAKIALRHQFNKRFSLNTNFLYETGIAVTLPIRSFVIIPDADPLPESGGRNSIRLPNSHRLDIGMEYKIEKAKFKHSFKLGIYNLYNQQNPLFIRIRRNPEDSIKSQSVQVTLLPILPSFSYTFRF